MLLNNIFHTISVPIKALAVTAGTPVSVFTPSTGSRFVLLGYSLSLSVAGSIIFEDATGSTNEFARTPLGAAANQAFLSPAIFEYVSNMLNNHLFLDVSASGSISGHLVLAEN